MRSLNHLTGLDRNTSFRIRFMNMISRLFLGHQADIRVFPIPRFSEHHTILSAEMILLRWEPPPCKPSGNRKARREINIDENGGFQRVSRQAMSLYVPLSKGTQDTSTPPAGEPGAAGHVQVDVTLHNPTPGTTARATARGRVTAAPPRIEQSLALTR
jgi:hypothetical protein